MEVYAIGLSWDNSVKTKQPLIIRLIDLDDNNKILDVTRKQLVQVMKSNKIKINNLELSKYNRLKGIDYSINSIPDLDKESDRYSAIVLNNTNGIYTLANYLGQIIKTPSLNTIELRNIKIVNIQVNKNVEGTTNTIKVSSTAEEQQNKYKLLLGGSKYNYLLKEPYINNIEFLFKLEKQLELGTDTKLKLNTNSYFNFDNRELDNIKLTNSFIAISNLITTIYKNDKTFFKEGFNSQFNIVKLYNNIYMDDNCKICVIEYKDTKERRADTWEPIKSIEIQINNKKVFETTYVLSRISSFSSLYFNQLDYLNKIKPQKENSISKYIQVGDVLSREGYIDLKLFRDNGMRIPNRIHEEIREVIVENWAILTEITEGKTKNILMFDTVDQLLIDIRYISNTRLIIKNILGLERINELNKKYIEKLTLAYRDKHTLNVLEYKTMSSNKMKELLSSKSNYDLNGNKEIAELANIVYREIGDKNTNNLSGLLKTSTINKILETDFFGKKTAKSSNRMLEFYKYSEQEIYKTSDSNIEIIEVYTDMKNDVWNKTSIIINSATNKVYICDKKLKTIIRMLYILGHSLNNRGVEDKPLNKITNRDINIQDFLICDTLICGQLCDNGYKVHIAFDRYNCDVYIISEWYDTDFKTILRFKRYRDAKDYVFNNIKIRWTSRDFIEFYNSTQNEDCLANYTDEALACMVARNSIMQGIPNNFPYIYRNVDFFDKLAKQPKN